MLDRENPVWFTKEIENGIKMRRHFNRLARNAQNNLEKIRHWDQYKTQQNNNTRKDERGNLKA